MRIKHHNGVPCHKGRHIREVVDGVETKTEAPSRFESRELRSLTDAAKITEVILTERRIIIHVESGALHLRKPRTKQRLRSVRMG